MLFTICVKRASGLRTQLTAPNQCQEEASSHVSYNFDPIRGTFELFDFKTWALKKWAKCEFDYFKIISKNTVLQIKYEYYLAI